MTSPFVDTLFVQSEPRFVAYNLLLFVYAYFLITFIYIT